VALLLMELGVRLVGPSPEPGAAVPAPPRDPALAGLPEFSKIDDLTRPNQRGVFKGVLYRTNSAGMRGPELALRAAPGTFRIAVIGDSIAMGQGVDEADTYAARLQRDLDARGAGRRYEVMNLGIAGMNILHCVRRLVNVGLRYRPDLVIYGYTLNDIEGPAYQRNTEEAAAAYRNLLARYQDSPSALLRAVWPRLVVLRSALWPIPGSYEYALEQNYFRRPEAWAQVTRGLDQLAAITRRSGICGVVFIHPVIQHLRLGHAFQRFYARVADAARERGLYAIQAYPHFRGRDSRPLRFDVFDRHPTAEGHRLLAEALLAGLEDLPPECGLRP
jgi:lysophospholipase L1-like esterase